MRTILICIAALVAGIDVVADSRPALVMRIDDNHSPEDWRQMCETFERHGLPIPRIWIRPGGWCPGFSQDSIERIYGREFGYNHQ